MRNCLINLLGLQQHLDLSHGQRSHARNRPSRSTILALNVVRATVATSTGSREVCFHDALGIGLHRQWQHPNSRGTPAAEVTDRDIGVLGRNRENFPSLQGSHKTSPVSLIRLSQLGRPCLHHRYVVIRTICTSALNFVRLQRQWLMRHRGVFSALSLERSFRPFLLSEGRAAARTSLSKHGDSARATKA